ncbi:MAG: TolC family protein [Hyphomicrobiaceae bacterium]|nr:TolC family protein [Hyphomicrobiaceae bacterium]
MSIWLLVRSLRLRSGVSVVMLGALLAACAGPRMGAGDCASPPVEKAAASDAKSAPEPQAFCTRTPLAPPPSLLTRAPSPIKSSPGFLAYAAESDALPITFTSAGRVTVDPVVTGSLASQRPSIAGSAPATGKLDLAAMSAPLPAAGPRAEADVTGSLGLPPSPPRKKDKPGRAISLADAIAQSIATHPDIAVTRAAADAARAGITVARAGFMPQVDGRINAGYGAPESPDDGFNPFVDGPEAQAQAAVTLRQLVFDFGATRDDVERSRSVLAAQNFKTMDKVEEVARKMADAYLKILEQRALLRAADANYSETRKLADLVRANQKDGNGTVADVSHIDARLVDAMTIRTNLQSDLGAAEDQFRRLAKMAPSDLKAPPSYARAIPPTVEAALSTAETHHPRILALRAQSDATQAELDAKRNSRFPKLTFEASASAKNQIGTSSSPEFDMRGMLVMRYKMFDGGARRGAEEEISARLTQNDMRLVSERDEIESDLREFYRAVRAARTKYASLQEGLAASRQAREMYVEQFKAGKRTMFELLDRQNGLFQAQRDVITNQFSETRANVGILRSIGLLTTTVIQR